MLLLLSIYKFLFLLDCVVYASWGTPWKKFLEPSLGKKWRNKRRLFGHLVHKRKNGKRRVKRSSSEWDWGQCSLEELHEWEQAKEKRKYREQKKIVRDIQWGKKQWVKRKVEFFFAQVVSLSVVSQFNIVKLFGVCLVVFPLNEKGFPCKSWCSYVIMLLLCLLKFVHSYIQFFSTCWTHRLALKVTTLLNLKLYWVGLALDIWPVD